MLGNLRARGFCAPLAAMPKLLCQTFSTVSVVGSGLMGAAIAAIFAAAKLNVSLVDTDLARLNEAEKRIRQIADDLLAAELITENSETVAARVVRSQDLVACKTAELVIEAIFENLAAKHELYAKLEELVGPSVVIGSNTSGFAPTDLSRYLKHPERFLVIHFWNPPHAIPLVEVVPSRKTKQDVIEVVIDFLTSIGS
jgi:3-hydroxybutyryl-CoA dehydrogenase